MEEVKFYDKSEMIINENSCGECRHCVNGDQTPFALENSEPFLFCIKKDILTYFTQHVPCRKGECCFSARVSTIIFGLPPLSKEPA